MSVLIGAARGQKDPARPPQVPGGRVVAGASERQADAAAGGIRRPEWELEAKRGGWPRPVRPLESDP